MASVLKFLGVATTKGIAESFVGLGQTGRMERCSIGIEIASVRRNGIRGGNIPVT